MSKKLSNDLEIISYMHCGMCLSSKPDYFSPAEFSTLAVGFTELGLQVWCMRHKVNVVHIDFEGHKHKINATMKGKEEISE